MSKKIGSFFVELTGDSTKLQKALAGAKKGLEKTKEAGKKSAMSIGELKDRVDLAQNAYGMLAGAVGQAYQAVGEGAQITAVSETFDALNSSIGETSETMLGSLSAATRGMVSDFDLMQASNKFVSMGLADTADEAAELAEMATQLGLAMGKGATESMEEMALMLANQSIPRLDSFGISAGKVRERINELTTGTNAMGREAAFMQATMEQADISMAKVGEQGGSQAASIAKLEATWQNLGDGIKVALADVAVPVMEAMTPAVESMAGSMKDAVRGMLADVMNLTGSIEEQLDATTRIMTAWQEADNLIGKLTGTEKELKQALDSQLAGLIKVTGGQKTYSEINKIVITQLKEHYGDAVKLDGMNIVLNGSTIGYATSLYAVAQKQKEQQIQQRAVMHNQFEATKVTEEATVAIWAEADAAYWLSQETKQSAAALDTHATAQWENNRELEEAHRINLELADSNDVVKLSVEELNAVEEEAARMSAIVAERRATEVLGLAAMESHIRFLAGEHRSEVFLKVFGLLSLQQAAALMAEIKSGAMTSGGGQAEAEQQNEAQRQADRATEATQNAGVGVGDTGYDTTDSYQDNGSGTGRGGTGFAHGGEFIVPAGYDNDSYRMRVSSGEKVTVQTAQQQSAQGAGGGQAVTIGTVNVQANDPQEMFDKLMEMAGREARQTALSGSGRVGSVR